MKYITNCLVLGICVAAMTSRVSAHSGRTDAFGCHNCYTSYCYGEYHCHNGGGGGGGGFVFPPPINPKSGTHSYKISRDNWCNYDLTMSWEKPEGNGDRFSIAISKYAGANPGPLADTSGYSFTFKNVPPGKWYINIKTGNFERWSSVSYWTINLPKPTSYLNAYISRDGDNQYLNYDLACLTKVEGPKEFIDYLNLNYNDPSGKVPISFDYPTTITVKGWDKNKKEYSQNLTYTPIPKANLTKRQSDDNSVVMIAILILILTGYGWWFYKDLTKK